MIESFGVPREKVARWAGITSAVFSLSQALTAIVWGRLSDKVGRKPTIMMGLTCTMLSSIFWGMSTSLPMAIVARALSGGCNGNVGIIRTMVAEMVTEKELQPRAFSIMPLVWSLGSIFGPSFGGFFAKPVENLPGLFGNSKFLARFPFALPNLVASVFFMVGITTGILFLKETLETKRHRRDYGLVLGKRLVALFKKKKQHKHFRNHSGYDESSASLLRPTSSDSSASKAFDDEWQASKPVLPRPTMTEVFTRQSIINLIAYTFLALHSVAYDQLLPIYMHHPRQTPDSSNTHLPFKFSGGFGLGSGRIGTLFTMYGVCGCIVQFLVFPPVVRRFGVLNCFKACGITFPVICFLTPYTALIQTSAHQQAAMFAIMIVKCFAVIFAFPCSVILLTNSAVSLRILATLNGFAVSISAIGRALGPAMAGAVFTWGLERGYVITPWWLLAFISGIGAIPIWWLVEMDGFSKTHEDDSDDESDSEDVDRLPQIAEDEEERAILNGDEHIQHDESEEALLINDTSPRQHEATKPRQISSRRLSSPIGMRGSVGPGGSRRLSNGLAQSNLGHGTGGSSFH
ncbi:MFS transporter [Phlyctema vagabunda]|uniref:MFS transporter n=1 Tax=Phlyctema vagabunda TaxID=108571 RepID=A0ABR4PPQ0_9HELO